ncbi:MAG: hypothetical protein WDZ93_03260 [Candidatus Paceibacterota bacterium]
MEIAPTFKHEDSENDERADFLELVNVCREVEEKGALPTAIEYNIDDESGFTEIMSDDFPEELRVEALKDLEAVTAKYNEFRYALSTSFDADAESWNNEPIGKTLKGFAVELQEYRGKIERGDVFDQAYLMDMYNAISSLMQLCNSDEYTALYSDQKLHALNEGARKYEHEKKVLEWYQALKRQTQVALYLHDELKRNPRDEMKRRLVEQFFSPEYVAVLKGKLSQLLEVKRTAE